MKNNIINNIVNNMSKVPNFKPVVFNFEDMGYKIAATMIIASLGITYKFSIYPNRIGYTTIYDGNRVLTVDNCEHGGYHLLLHEEYGSFTSECSDEELKISIEHLQPLVDKLKQLMEDNEENDTIYLPKITKI